MITAIRALDRPAGLAGAILAGIKYTDGSAGVNKDPVHRNPITLAPRAMPFSIASAIGRAATHASRAIIAVGIFAAVPAIAESQAGEIRPGPSAVPGVPFANVTSARIADGDSAAAALVVSGFHDALAAGDSAKALSLLDPAVVILESGDEEHLADYRSHHLAADIEFTKGVKTKTAPIRLIVRGDVAWATSTSTTTGTFRGRTIDSAGAELMVLARTAGVWRIVAIHWSSHRRAP